MYSLFIFLIISDVIKLNKINTIFEEHSLRGVVLKSFFLECFRRKQLGWSHFSVKNDSIKGEVPQFLENFQSSYSVEHMRVAASEINARNLFKVTNKDMTRTLFDIVMVTVLLILNMLTWNINLFASILNFLISALMKTCTLS